MTNMIRKQIYLGKQQQQWLKRQAKARKLSEAEIIREALDWQALQPNTPVFQPDPEAWSAVLKLIDARIALGVTGEPYKFNRQELYDERENRWVKR